MNGILSVILDKHPQLNEFLTQIKNTPDLSNLFESIQKDANPASMYSVNVGYSTSLSGDYTMDLS